MLDIAGDRKYIVDQNNVTCRLQIAWYAKQELHHIINCNAVTESINDLEESKIYGDTYDIYVKDCINSEKILLRNRQNECIDKYSRNTVAR